MEDYNRFCETARVFTSIHAQGQKTNKNQKENAESATTTGQIEEEKTNLKLDFLSESQ